MNNNEKLPFALDKTDKDKDNKPAKTGKKSNTEKTKEFIALVFKKNPVGAPRMYATKDELEAEVVSYFTHCYEEGIKLTISGLVLYLGFSDRRSFYDYELIPEFTHTIKKARALITMHYEGLLTEAFPQGAVFALKNLGWTAEEEKSHTIKTQTEFYIGGDDDQDENTYTDYEQLEDGAGQE